MLEELATFAWQPPSMWQLLVHSPTPKAHARDPAAKDPVWEKHDNNVTWVPWPSKTLHTWNIWLCKNLMYSKNGVVYKLHAGWFINSTPGEFINRGLFKFKGVLCGKATERGEIEYKISGRQAVYKSNPGNMTVCRKREASGQGKIQYIKYLHCQKILGELIFGSLLSFM